MKEAIPFNSHKPIFSKKQYLQKQKQEKQKLKQIRKSLKKQFLQQQKRKNKTKRIIKNIEKKPIKHKIKENKPIIKNKPSLKELEQYLEKLTLDYDKNTKKIKKYSEQIRYLKQLKKEQKEKKIENRIIKTLEKRKEIEQNINELHKIIFQKNY